jgi:hypothetical protein
MLPKTVKVNFGGVIIQKGIFAMVESSTHIQDPEEIAASDLFIPLQKEADSIDGNGFVTKRKFYFADVEAFLEPLCTVPDIGSNPKCKYFQVKPRRKWADDFTSWIMEPHYNDVIDVDDDEMEDDSELSEEEEDEGASSGDSSEEEGSTVAETDASSEKEENSELEDEDSEEESDSESEDDESDASDDEL